MISLCLQLQLKQYDGALPLPPDIQSNPVSVRVSYYNTSYYIYGRLSSSITRNLTVPESGIMILTVPVNADSERISIWVFFHFLSIFCVHVSIVRVLGRNLRFTFPPVCFRTGF